MNLYSRTACTDKFLPHLLGHERGGIVLETGHGVTRVKKDDHVVSHWRKGFGIEAPTPKYNWDHKSFNRKNHLKYLKSVSSTYFSEIQKRSILTLLKITGCKLYNIWENRAPWPIKVRFWYHLVRLIFVPIYKKKRIFGIWDYKALPWSVGDTLVFIEKLNILKIQYNAEEIDICIVYDRENPGGNRRGSNLTPENAQDYMLDFLPLFSTCPYLGSIYQFNSRNEYYQFLKNNFERYNIFPPFGHHLAETYNYNKGEPHLNEIQEFYNTHGYIPYLRIGVRDNYWAQWFYLNYLPEGKIPVTLTLRQLVGSPERNADPSVWLSFIDKCKTNLPEVVFVFIGLREEVFEGLRAMQNVIIAKDFGSTIIEDLALIRASIMYMGTNSGVNIIAQFSDLPHLIFQFPNIHKYGLNLGDNFSFATDKQKIFSSAIKVTPELLFNEFKALYSRLDRNKWRSLALENARIKHGHPSAVVEKKE